MTTQLPAGTWYVAPSSTTVTLTATKLGLFKIPAELAIESGQIEVGDDNTVRSVSFGVDAASYSSPNPKRNEHVVSPDFLDATTHPVITFESSQVEPTGDGYAATGEITVKGQTSPMTAEVRNVRIKNGRATFTASATVDRNAVGVSAMPSFIVAPTVDLVVDVAATTTAPPKVAAAVASPRLQEFQRDIQKLGVKGGAAEPERKLLALGVIATIAGLVTAIVGLFGVRGTDSELAQGDSLALLLLGIAIAIIGAVLWARYSLTRYLRYWLVRDIFEERAQADRIVDAIERSSTT